MSAFEWKAKEHYLKNEPCLFCILTVPGKDIPSVSKVVWFIQSPNHCLHKESTLFSVGFSLIDIHWFHRGLGQSQGFSNSFGVWPISSAHVKPSNAMLIFMLTDGFTPQSNVFCWQIIWHPLRNVAQHPHGGNALSCTGLKAPEVIPSCKLSLCHYNYLKTFLKSYFISVFDFFILSGVRQTFHYQKEGPVSEASCKAQMLFPGTVYCPLPHRVTLQYPPGSRCWTTSNTLQFACKSALNKKWYNVNRRFWQPLRTPRRSKACHWTFNETARICNRPNKTYFLYIISFSSAIKHKSFYL